MTFEKIFEMVPKILRNLTLGCCLWAVLVNTSSVVLQDNGYEGVVVALDDRIPSSMCQEVVQGLEEVIKSASSVIFKATRGRASFRSVSVLVPSSWSATSCPTLWSLQEAISETWDRSDLRVTLGKHPRHGARPWTLHTKGCGRNGDYISMGHELMLANDTLNNGRLLAQEWLKYRYGVFEEAGWVVNPIHPSHYRSSDGLWIPNACSNVPLRPNPSCHAENSSCPFKIDVEDTEELTKSFMAFPELPTVTELCDEGSHNSEAPTRHNFLCNGKSVWEVMRASSDFQNNRNVEGGIHKNEITFNYVSSSTPRIVLLVDDSSVMNNQNRWDFMRKAVRKFITYDIPDGYSVGLVVFNSIPSTRYPLTVLTDGSTREKVGSALPRNPSIEYEQNRCVTCGIREAMKLIYEQGVGGHIVMVVAGGSTLSEDEIMETSQLLRDAHVSLHAILYPLAEKYPSPNGGVELLASRSGGDTFIVRDEGIDEESKLSMYYNLLDSFYNSLLVVSGQKVLPVKIHSAEHIGAGKVKVSQGSFVIDPSLGTDTTFAIFYYDVTHVGNQVHLINPKGQVIDTANMQKEDNNINMITVHLVEVQVTPGLWHYKVENRADSHQALYVQVTSRPRPMLRVPSVSIRTWTSHSLVNASDINTPLAIYAEVRAGLMGIMGAKAIAVLQNLDYVSNGTLYPPLRVLLVDNGFAGPDMARGDGVYSRYIPGLVSAKYTITVMVEGEIGGHKFTRQSRLGIVDVIEMSPLEDKLPPSRVADFHAVFLPDTINRISFTWTAPGDDFDFGTADHYVVLSSNKHQELVEGGGIVIEDWASPLESSTAQQHSIEWEFYETVHYFAIIAVDESGNAAALSNIISVYVPTPPTTTPPPIFIKPTTYFDSVSSDQYNSTAPMLAHFNTQKLAIIFGCIGGFIIVIMAVVCFCAIHHRQHQKTSTDKNHEIQDTYNINVTVASKGVDFPDGKDNIKENMKREYVSPVESWSASELLSSHHDENMSSRSDENSDHSTSTKKSYGGSSDPNDYLIEGSRYRYPHSSYPLHYSMPSDGYPTPTKVYPSECYPPPSEAHSYISSQPSDSFLSVSCDILPSSHGPPSYMPYPCYDASLRSNKVPPPIPPKPKVLYTPEPYAYDRHSLGPRSVTPSLSSEKRVRNVTMV